jgi:formate-dependent nitrite reductase membrane component NrfD
MIRYERRWENRRGGSRRDRSRRDAPRDGVPRDDSQPTRPQEGYYGLPAIHGPHWNWLIVAYFFLGGIAGGSYALASIADLLGGEGNRRIARAGRYLSLAATIPCPLLLILDLGRPERFHHMLRVVKIRSPLSLGTWILLGFSAFSGSSAVVQAANDGLFGRNTLPARLAQHVPARALGAVGIAPAFALSGYTGTLLGATAVPLWGRNARYLGPLFLASSLANASAALALILAAPRRTDHQALARLERFDTIAQLAEASLLAITQARLGRALDKPLRQGTTGLAYRAGVHGLGLGLPLGLRLLHRLLGRHPGRLATALSALLTLAGGIFFRYAMVYGGKASANDSQATFEYTRE